MTTATEFFADLMSQAPAHLPSITLCSLQRNAAQVGDTRWAPGIASYSWGLRGRVVHNGPGNPDSLQIGVLSWFSDRRTNPSVSPPDWQQFAATARDTSRLTFTPVGDAVRLRFELLTWHSEWTADSTGFDEASQQLLFSVPGAGPNAPRALMIVTFHLTGDVGFV